MVAGGFRSVPQSIVARRLCDLLSQFPAASTGGVPWRSLALAYEERYSKLNLKSRVATVSALLWDVGSVDTKDRDNPIITLEDGVASSRCAGCWPSLYAALCEIVRHHAPRGGPLSLPLSRLRSLLEASQLDLERLTFFNDKGEARQIEGVVEVVNAMINWRAQRVQWQRASGRRSSLVTGALRGELKFASTPNGIVLLLLEKHTTKNPVSNNAQTTDLNDQIVEEEYRQLRSSCIEQLGRIRLFLHANKALHRREAHSGLEAMDSDSEAVSDSSSCASTRASTASSSEMC
eukprot:CAMPEP_0194487566 /NCGR_PEP_ID=MMETSP0253-20130528/7806_1 /TAXON_ID=2966 /ORGANISM="Noctiluca scintillans" /LENGTH=290 /DNA_ID=CAMNT_0039327811 /DNA_START=57 /DNA_END=929 /DNA_ORIENTATION=-